MHPCPTVTEWSSAYGTARHAALQPRHVSTGRPHLPTHAGFPSGVHMSEIRLRNATLISAPDTCALDTAAVKAVRAVAFANALGGEGLAERAAYAQVRGHVALWHVALLAWGLGTRTALYWQTSTEFCGARTN